MLSWSAEATGTPVDTRAVTDPSTDPLVPGGKSLLAFVDAVVSGSSDPAAARTDLAARLGEPPMVGAAAVIANFQMMNRIADATGMPVGRGSRLRNAELIATLGLDRFDHHEDPETEQ